MAKLYPPQIEGVIPAFYGTTLVVPFIMNKTVGRNQVTGIALKIKSIYNNAIVHQEEMKNIAQIDFDNYAVTFSIPDNIFTIGTSYKVQIAYIDDTNTIGPFSTVGIVKYTTKPKISIEGLKLSNVNNHIANYVGIYNQLNGDVTEKVYSYNFTIYDENNNVFETSGELVHNHEEDNMIYETSDSYAFTNALDRNKLYKIVYTVTTMNGLVISSPEYKITEQGSKPLTVFADITANMNNENGYTAVQLIGHRTTDNVETTALGTFVLCRSTSANNYSDWMEIDRFALVNEKPSSYIYKDFTIEHGYTYRYSVQQYNKGQIYSDRKISNEIEAYFEHSFLYDGKRQLKIKYNPKVTSFKETLLEQKTNTLGGKYPFFFRNGNVGYKEFPISGLISYHSDEEELFLSTEDLLLEDLSDMYRQSTTNSSNAIIKNRISQGKTKTSNLTDYNIMAERIFKMKVLEFLNNGQPKLFRSPGEGNYIVRLMNSSLSPDDKVNRMLHTFSTTATEIDEFTNQKLNKYNFISINEPVVTKLMWKTVMLKKFIDKNIQKANNSQISIGQENKILSIDCQDMMINDKIWIEYEDSITEIQIGITGNYYVEFTKPVQRILISTNTIQGQITYSYYDRPQSEFDRYTEFIIKNTPVAQFREYTIDQDIRQYFELDDVKHVISNYYFLQFSKDENYAIQQEKAMNRYDWKVASGKISQIVCDNYQKQIHSAYTDKLTTNLYKFWIDGEEFDISDIPEYFLSDLDHIPIIKLGVGICLDISYQQVETVYDIEETNDELKNLKSDYQLQYDELLKTLHCSDSGVNEIEKDQKDLQLSYDKFILALSKALVAEEEIGVVNE